MFVEKRNKQINEQLTICFIFDVFVEIVIHQRDQSCQEQSLLQARVLWVFLQFFEVSPRRLPSSLLHPSCLLPLSLCQWLPSQQEQEQKQKQDLVLLQLLQLLKKGNTNTKFERMRNCFFFGILKTEKFEFYELPAPPAFKIKSSMFFPLRTRSNNEGQYG